MFISAVFYGPCIKFRRDVAGYAGGQFRTDYSPWLSSSSIKGVSQTCFRFNLQNVPLLSFASTSTLVCLLAFTSHSNDHSFQRFIQVHPRNLYGSVQSGRFKTEVTKKSQLGMNLKYHVFGSCHAECSRSKAHVPKSGKVHGRPQVRPVAVQSFDKLPKTWCVWFSKRATDPLQKLACNLPVRQSPRMQVSICGGS